MSTNPDPREELLKTFASKFGDADGERVLDSLVLSAQQIAEPSVRCGFQDAILVILRNRARGRDLGKPRSVRGAARLSGQPQESISEE